ncbi:MAG: type IV secretion system protein [Burkholderia sp.]
MVSAVARKRRHETPDEFASVLLIDGQSSASSQNQIASTIDDAIDKGLTTAKQAFANACVFSGPGIASGLLGVAVLLSTILMCGLRAGFILMAKFLLGVTVCFGPIFIFCLLFPSLNNLFTKWIGSVINYGLVTVLLSAVFGLMMAFYQKAITAASAANPSSPILVPIITCGLLTVISWFVLKQVPDMAARWGDGVTANVLNHISSPGGNKGSGGGSGGGSKGGSGGAAGGGAAGGAAAGAAGGVAGAAAGAAGAVANEVGGAMQGMARGSRR